MLRTLSIFAVLFVIFLLAPASARIVSPFLDEPSGSDLAHWFFYAFLSNPNIFYLLIIIGFYALLYEFTVTSFGFSAVLGVVLLSLAYVSFQQLPVNWVGLALIALALGLFLTEAFIPGIGIMAVAGIILMAAGSMYLFHPTTPPVRVDYPVVLVLTLVTAFLTVFLVRSAIRSQRAKVLSGQEGMIGLKGEVSSDIMVGKAGKVSAQGTLWNAVSDETIAKGETVEIVNVDGLVIKVKRVLPEKKGA